MARSPYHVRPETAVLTRGFDPQLSVGSARPPVYRSSTYVFSSPEAAERAFAIVLGKTLPLDDEAPDLIYARLNHPNAQILEDQLVPLERGASAAAVAVADNRLCLGINIIRVTRRDGNLDSAQLITRVDIDKGRATAGIH